MPAHGLYGETRGIRWDREEECFTAKCNRCAAINQTRCYWPLTLEFWNPSSMQRCRACNADLKRIKQRVYAGTPEQRAKARVYARTYYHENRDAVRVKQREYKRRRRAVWSDG